MCERCSDDGLDSTTRVWKTGWTGAKRARCVGNGWTGAELASVSFHCLLFAFSSFFFRFNSSLHYGLAFIVWLMLQLTFSF